MSRKPDLVPSVNRIVIGDVGSGKTIVAFLLGLSYLHGRSEGGVAMLAPTEVLAYQHYLKLLELKERTSDLIPEIDLVFVTAKNIQLNGVKVTKNQLAKAELKSKTFWLGTHALLHNEAVQVQLVLVDEQHRFGVRQRQQLSKSTTDAVQNFSAHFVSFSATPIPRTLALTIYRSLKPHFLKSLSGRQPIATSIHTFEELEPVLIPQIGAELRKGRKVYVICPKIEDKEEGEADELWSVGRASKLLEKHFAGQVMSVHGKVVEKKDLLSQFKESQSKNILVATTVIEVGVDVPQASLVMILNAERFGLAALHQIRGRVGRNDWPDNLCLLVTEEDYKFNRRLRYLTQSQDGFVLAQKDLELRGAGDMTGTAQSGYDTELEALMGLQEDFYESVSALVDQVDFAKLSETMPRLANYLAKESEKYWEE